MLSLNISLFGKLICLFTATCTMARGVQDRDAMEKPAMLQVASPNHGSINVYNISIHNDQKLLAALDLSSSVNNSNAVNCGNVTSKKKVRNMMDNRKYNTWMRVKYKITCPQAKTLLDDLLNNQDHVFVHILDTLMNDLEVDYILLGTLRKHKVLTKQQCEEILKENNTPTDKAALTLAYVQKKGDLNLGYFIIALFKSLQQHLIYHIVCGLKQIDNQTTLESIVQTIQKKWEEL